MAEPPWVYQMLEDDERRKQEKQARRHERIARIAQKKWKKAGRPEGRDLEFWLEAEKEYDWILHGE